MVTTVPVPSVLSVVVEAPAVVAEASPSLSTRLTRALGTLSLLGSAFGLLLTAWYGLATVASGALPFVNLLWTGALCGGVALCFAWGVGTGIALRRQHPAALWAALPFWLLQVPIVSSPLATLSLYSGLAVPVTVMFQDGVNFYAGINLGSGFETFFLNPAAPWGFGINLFAVAAVVFLTVRLLQEKWSTIPGR